MAYKSGSSILRKRANASSDTDQFWDKEIRDHDRKKRRLAQKQFKKIRKFGGYPETRDPKSVTKKNFGSSVFEGSLSPSRLVRRLDSKSISNSDKDGIENKFLIILDRFILEVINYN